MEQVSDAAADLASCLKIHASDKFEESVLRSCVADIARGTKIFVAVPEELRKNIEYDLPIMRKKKEKLLSELDKMNKRISTQTYSVKTAPEVQKEHSNKVNHNSKIS